MAIIFHDGYLSLPNYLKEEIHRKYSIRRQLPSRLKHPIFHFYLLIQASVEDLFFTIYVPNGQSHALESQRPGTFHKSIEYPRLLRKSDQIRYSAYVYLHTTVSK